MWSRLLKIISNRRAENAKRPGKPPFPDFQGHFHGNEDDLELLDIASGSLAC